MKNRKSIIQIVAVITGVVVAATAFFYSCDKTNKGPVADINKAESYDATNQDKPIVCGSGNRVEIVSVGENRVGELQVSNDGRNLHVNYALDKGYDLSEVNLYLGNKNTIPVKADGQPDVTKFPYSVKFTANGVRLYSFAIPLSGIGSDCNAVAAHALIKVVDDGGQSMRTQDAWAKGDVIYKSDMQRVPAQLMGMQFEYCKQPCNDDKEGCANSAVYWFEGKEGAWENNQVVVAGHVYTKEEALAIYQAGHPAADSHARTLPSTVPDSKKCFVQIAAIRLSGKLILAPASVWADVNAAEKWLAGLGKLSLTNLPGNNPEAAAAAQRIEEWIGSHSCAIK